MFKALALAGAVTAAALLSPVQPTHAAPAEQVCQATAFRQHDLAGTYESSAMRVIVFPCGGITIHWLNQFGEHGAAYGSYLRVPSGGVIAQGIYPDPVVGYLDGAFILGVKPAEVGWVQIYTATNAGIVGEYRLRKIAGAPAI